MDILTILLGASLFFAFGIFFTLKGVLKKAKNLSKFQTYSKSVQGSIIETGAFTEHGMVHDPKTNSVKAQHKKSQFFYETVI